MSDVHGNPVSQDRLQKTFKALHGRLDSFFVRNPERVEEAVQAWRQAMPAVTPHYAVKSNSSEWLIEKLQELGVPFDCASKQEIDVCLAKGATQIVYSNPIKRISDLTFAVERGIQLTVADTEAELVKIAKISTSFFKVMLRFRVDDAESKICFSNKFGASYDEVVNMLLKSKELGLEVVGFSFHIGSGGNKNPAATFGAALRQANALFDEARRVGFQPSIVDIGGGFSHERGLTEDLSKTVRDLTANIPTVIAEPGRFISSRCLDLVVRVIGKRVCKDGRVGYHLDDSVYHNFNCVVHDMFEPAERRVTAIMGSVHDDGTNAVEMHNQQQSRVFGMTCDGADVISDCMDLPELQVGDWLYWPDMGAYTNGAATDFNGLSSDKLGEHL